MVVAVVTSCALKKLKKKKNRVQLLLVSYYTDLVEFSKHKHCNIALVFLKASAIAQCLLISHGQYISICSDYQFYQLICAFARLQTVLPLKAKQSHAHRPQLPG
jgi:hypothetical protein